MTKSIISINLYNNNNSTTINKTPIMFFSTKENVKEDFLYEKKFKKYLQKHNCFTDINIYSNIDINYCNFFFNDINKYYKEDSLSIQDVFDINNLENIDELILDIFIDIFKKCEIKEEKTTKVPSTNEKIIYIYTKIKEKYESQNKSFEDCFYKRITKVINTKYNLNEKNTNLLIKKIKEIIHG